MAAPAPASFAPVALSHDGPHLSPIVAGAWRMAEWGWNVQQRLRWIEQCLELGITGFDHADIYGDYTVETLFGEALAQRPALRQRVQIVTKCGVKLVSPRRPGHAAKSYDSSAEHVTASVDASLRALRTDHIDVLLIHRPDALMDPLQLAHTGERLRAAGKVAHFGVSNHSRSQFELLHRHLPLVTNQIELSPLRTQALSDGTLDQCLQLSLRPMIWSPLAGGELMQATHARARRVRSVLEDLGRRYGASVSTMAYAWILRHPSHPVCITGSHRLERMRDAVAALGIRISGEDWYRVWQASTGRPLP